MQIKEYNNERGSICHNEYADSVSKLYVYKENLSVLSQLFSIRTTHNIIH